MSRTPFHASMRVMAGLRVGERYDKTALLRQHGWSERPDVATPSASLHDEAIFVRVLPDAQAHFCVKRTMSLDEPEAVEAHLDWHMGPTRVEVPKEAVLFVETGPDQVAYLGAARLVMHGTRTSGVDVQYALRQLPHELDPLLRARARSPMDGSSLAQRIRAGADRHALAGELSESWLGPMPDCPPPEVSAAAPADVRAWHSLWAKLATFEDHPWCCWPATWRRSEAGLHHFQDEWQNGGTFGVKDGKVWVDGWLSDEGHDVVCADDMGELALQFVIFGLAEGASGTYVVAGEDAVPALEIAPLPLGRWTWFFGTSIDFVGGDGCIGTLCDGGVQLRTTTRERAIELRARLR